MARGFFSKVGRKIKQHRFGIALVVATVVGFIVYPLGIMVTTGMAVYLLWLVLSALVGFVGGEHIKWLSTRFLQYFSKKWGKIVIDHLSDCVAIGALFLVASFFFPPLAVPGILFLTGPMVVNGIAFLIGAVITGIVKISRCCFCQSIDDTTILPDDFGISSSSQRQEQRQNHLPDKDGHINKSVSVGAEHNGDVSNGNERENNEIDVVNDTLMKNKKIFDDFVDKLIDKETLSSQQHNLNKRPSNNNRRSDTPSLSNKKHSSGQSYILSTPHTVFTMTSTSVKKTWKHWGIFKCFRSCCADDSDEPSYKDSNAPNLTNNNDGTTFVNYGSDSHK